MLETKATVWTEDINNKTAYREVSVIRSGSSEYVELSVPRSSHPKAKSVVMTVHLQQLEAALTALRRVG